MTASETDRRIDVVDQFKLALYASKDKRLSAGDLAVLLEIDDRILKTKGNISRPTGISHLARETRRNSRTVRDSLEKLLDLHYVTIVKAGAGTRGTEYAINVEWERHVSVLRSTEIESRRAAKIKAASLRAQAHASKSGPDCVNASTLETDACVNTSALADLVCVPAPPQSYFVGPTSVESYEEDDADTDAGLTAAPCYVAEITFAKYRRWSGSRGASDWKELIVNFLVDGRRVPEVFIVEHLDEATLADGTERLSQLLTAVGDFESPDELKGRRLTLCGWKGAWTYSRAPANDNHRPDEAVAA